MIGLKKEMHVNIQEARKNPATEKQTESSKLNCEFYLTEADT